MEAGGRQSALRRESISPLTVMPLRKAIGNTTRSSGGWRPWEQTDEKKMGGGRLQGVLIAVREWLKEKGSLASSGDVLGTRGVKGRAVYDVVTPRLIGRLG